jgi:uncharacterized protein YabE (DUF348 family)
MSLSRHPFAVPFITFAALLLLTAGFFAFWRLTHAQAVTKDNKIVIISHDHVQQVVPSNEDTVGELLQKLNIELGQGDVVEPALTTAINQDQFRINIYRAVPVEIVDGGSRTFAYSASTTGRSISSQAGIGLYPEDRANIEPEQDFLKSASLGKAVVIDRATPVNVDLYGTHVVLRTHAHTVGELMQEKNIKLDKNDKVTPALDTPITPEQQVAFIRTGNKVETITENIAMPVQKINDPTLAYGTRAVRQEGANGQQVVTYQVSLINNIETGRSVIQKVVTKEPVTQIEVIGTSLSGIKGDMALAGIAPGDYNYVDYIVSHESGWNPAASNPSGAYGLCQALPGSKMASYGADWQTNPVTQLRWCNGYAKGHYGSWAAAYSFWISHRYW